MRYISLAECLSAHVRLCNNIIPSSFRARPLPPPPAECDSVFFLVHIIISPMTRSGGKSSAAVAGCNAVPCKVNRQRRQCRTPIPRPTDHRRPPLCVVPRCATGARARIPFGARAPVRSSLISSPEPLAKTCAGLMIVRGGTCRRGTHTYARQPPREIARAHDAARYKTCVCVCHTYNILCRYTRVQRVHVASDRRPVVPTMLYYLT